MKELSSMTTMEGRSTKNVTKKKVTWLFVELIFLFHLYLVHFHDIKKKWNNLIKLLFLIWLEIS